MEPPLGFPLTAAQKTQEDPSWGGGTLYSGKDNTPIWEERVWTARNNMKIYGSTWMWTVT